MRPCLFVVLIACGGKDPPPASPSPSPPVAVADAAVDAPRSKSEELFAEMTAFKDEMCACKDKACADAVHGRLQPFLDGSTR